MTNPSVEVDLDQAITATNRFEPTTDTIHSSISGLNTVRYSQTESKWGVAKGPDQFRRQYTKCMDEGLEDLEAMERNLEAFITEVRKALRDFEANESDQEVASRFAIKEIDKRAESFDDSGVEATAYNSGVEPTAYNSGVDPRIAKLLQAYGPN